MPLTGVAIALTGQGAVGDWGRNALAYDLTTGALVGMCDFDTRTPSSLVYRPDEDDLLVAASGATQGGTLFRVNLSLEIQESVVLPIPALPSTDLWALRMVRSDFHGGVFLGYTTASGGTNTGDQFVRQIDPVTFAPVEDWQTFLTPDERSFLPGDFALDGDRLIFAMSGGPDFDQNVLYQVDLPTSVVTAFASYGGWSGGVNPTGNTYRDHGIRPRADGTYVAATMQLSGTDGNVLNELLLIDGDGTVTATWPLLPTSPSGTHMYFVTGVAVAGDTAWFVTGNGILARMDLTTGVQTTLVPANEDGMSFIDLIVFVDGPTPPVPPPPMTTTVGTYTLTGHPTGVPALGQRTSPQRRLRRAPHLTDEARWLFYTSLQIDMETGVGLSSGQGEDPQVMLRWSDDGGQTWSHEHWTSAGRLGEYRTRVTWHRLGRARDRVFEVVVSDPVSWNLSSAYLDVEPGTH